MIPGSPGTTASSSKASSRNSADKSSSGAGESSHRHGSSIKKDKNDQQSKPSPTSTWEDLLIEEFEYQEKKRKEKEKKKRQMEENFMEIVNTSQNSSRGSSVNMDDSISITSKISHKDAVNMWLSMYEEKVQTDFYSKNSDQDEGLGLYNEHVVRKYNVDSKGRRKGNHRSSKRKNKVDKGGRHGLRLRPQQINDDFLDSSNEVLVSQSSGGSSTSSQSNNSSKGSSKGSNNNNNNRGVGGHHHPAGTGVPPPPVGSPSPMVTPATRAVKPNSILSYPGSPRATARGGHGGVLKQQQYQPPSPLHQQPQHQPPSPSQQHQKQQQQPRRMIVKKKKSVTYCETVRAKNTIHRNDYTDEEFYNTWFDEEELSKMYQEAIASLNVFKSMMNTSSAGGAGGGPSPNVLMSPGGNMASHHGNTASHRNAIMAASRSTFNLSKMLCFRGLEYMSPEAQERRDLIRQSACLAVLEEQERLRNGPGGRGSGDRDRSLNSLDRSRSFPNGSLTTGSTATLGSTTLGSATTGSTIDCDETDEEIISNVYKEYCQRPMMAAIVLGSLDSTEAKTIYNESDYELDHLLSRSRHNYNGHSSMRIISSNTTTTAAVVRTGIHKYSNNAASVFNSSLPNMAFQQLQSPYQQQHQFPPHIPKRNTVGVDNVAAVAGMRNGGPMYYQGSPASPRNVQDPADMGRVVNGLLAQMHVQD